MTTRTAMLLCALLTGARAALEPRANVGFYHIALTGQWQPIVRAQLDHLAHSGLLDATKMLYVTVLGDRAQWNHTLLAGVDRVVTRFAPDLSVYEYPTLEALHGYCVGNPSERVYYFHNKGSNSPDPESQRFRGAREWREVMQHFIFTRWRDCALALDSGLIACGSNLRGTRQFAGTNLYRHYSGNFWWASCDYIGIKHHSPSVPTAYWATNFPWPPPHRQYCEGWLMDTEYVQGFDAIPARNCFDDNTDHYVQSFDVGVLENMTCLGV